MARHSPWSDVKDPDFLSHPLSAVRSHESPGLPSNSSPGWNISAAKAWNSSPSNGRRNLPAEPTPNKIPGGDKDLWSRFEQVKSIESYKNALIEEVLLRCEYLSEQCQRISDVYERDREYAADLQRREKAYQDNIRRMKTIMDRDPFVLVLIDGNGMTFDERHLQRGESGGNEAASLLYESIKEYVSQNLPDIPREARVVARVYANFDAVGEACWNAGMIDHPSKFNDFARGFLRGESLFDFIDVGGGKDFADAKIADFFKLHLYDYHCRQIFFGCSSNQSFAALLDQLANDEQCTKRITLLEGLPFGEDFENLPFERTRLASVFRSSKLDLNTSNPCLSASPNPPANGQLLPPPPTQPMSQMDLKDVNDFTSRFPVARAASVSTDSQTRPSPVTSWASAVKASAPIAPPSAAQTSSTVPKAATSSVPRNRKGQRVDPLIKHDKDEVDRIKKKKWCNVHFLRSECPYGDSCTHVHSAKPTPVELQTLRLVARMAPCMNGSDCDDAKCIYGHICPAPEGRDGKDCIFGENCRFPSYMHKIDRNVVKTVKV